MNGSSGGWGKGGRDRAYRVGARIAREVMVREAPLDAGALETVEASDIVVLPGSYDRVQQVLDALAIPYTLLPAERLSAVRLRPEQLLVVNCPGTLGRREVTRVRQFVESGGSLFTTDWSLRHVIEPAFPGLLRYNERPTADEVVRIEVLRGDNPFLQGVMEGADDPLWWLEGSSYPIQVLDPARVEVLIRSAELEARYGEAPVAVLFRWGDGDVFHMISHYYLQRAELRTARHQESAFAFATEKGVAVDEPMAPDLDGLAVGDVEPAASSSRLLANVIARKKSRGSPVRVVDPS